MTLRPGYDWFHAYYRDRALCLQLGVTPLDMLLASCGADSIRVTRAARCRRTGAMPVCTSSLASSATPRRCCTPGSAAEAGVLYSRLDKIPNRESMFHGDEIVYTSLGEGSTSEGEFWEAVNISCTRHLPVLFLVEDNGYAISVPVEVETPGGSISKLLTGFPGLHIESADGTDFFDSLRAMRAAADYVRARKGPALVHAHVARPYSHSLSDDEKRTRRRQSVRTKRGAIPSCASRRS